MNEMTDQTPAVKIVRHGELKPCRTAFIDAHTPGSDRKENFTIIGAGVSESPDQFVHIRDAPGFNIGAAGQPPRCRNSLHVHRTAEVFFVQAGRWRFFWGRHGDAGEVVLEEGDVFDIPTGIFRGFENVGTDYGMIMSILGGNDAGGGVIWAPQVIEEARAHGLVLSEAGRLYDSKRGEHLPPGVAPMPPLGETDLARFPETPVEAVVPRFVARYQDIRARAARVPALVIGASGALITDRPGFEVDLVTRGSAPAVAATSATYQVLMVHRGQWRLAWQGGEAVLAPGDTCAFAAGLTHSLVPAMSGEASVFRVRPTGDPAGPTLP
jgi:mannose-6-phosphate isomerase-like protein (cupin superfamily)